MDFLEHLAQEIERTGHAVSRNGASFVVEPLQVKIECEITGRKDNSFGGNYVMLNLTVKATNEELFPEGIFDCLVGIGTNDNAALSYASQIWTDGFFLPIHELITGTETEIFQVNRMNLVSRNEETGEELPWKLFAGILQANDEAVNLKINADELTLVKTLFDSMIAALHEKKLFWIKTFIGKFKDGSVQGDCWLNNQDWIEGLNSLHQFAEEWKGIKEYATMKQFIIIKPCEWSEIENLEEFRQSVPPIKKKSFFGKWLSG